MKATATPTRTPHDKGDSVTITVTRYDNDQWQVAGSNPLHSASAALAEVTRLVAQLEPR